MMNIAQIKDLAIIRVIIDEMIDYISQPIIVEKNSNCEQANIIPYFKNFRDSENLFDIFYLDDCQAILSQVNLEKIYIFYMYFITKANVEFSCYYSTNFLRLRIHRKSSTQI